MTNKIETKTNLNRNYCLAFFEALACILIIFIHIGPPGGVGVFLRALGRFGVPFFFAVSGFFLYKEGITKEETRSKLKKRIKHVGLLFLVSSLLYLAFHIIIAAAQGGGEGIKHYFESNFTWTGLISLVLFNHPIINPYGWFLLGMILAYIFIYLFPNLFIKNKFFIYVIFCSVFLWLAARIVVILTHPVINGFSLNAGRVYLTWFNNSLPFMCLGIILKKNQDKLKNIPFKYALIGLLFSVALMVSEMFLMGLILGKATSYCIGNILCVVFMFAVAIQKPQAFHKMKVLNLEGDWKTYVYLVHPAVMIALNVVFSSTKFTNRTSKWIAPFIVVVISLLLAFAINSLIVFISKKTKENRANKLENNQQQG